jgi:large subunit ribosomal protein L3
MAWLLAKKLEMTRIVKGDKFIPVTLLEIPEMRVVWFKTIQKDGYEALIVGILAKKAEWKLKEGKTTLSKNEFTNIHEFELNEGDAEKFNVGDVVNIDTLEGIEKVTLVGFSKWKWFTWAMKKHNFHGWPAGHGSKFHRALGSIGNRKPTRTHKGKKMHWHHGNIKVNLKKVPVELVNKEINVIGVRWGVPGWRNSIVSIIF